jgi:hypothetical protein
MFTDQQKAALAAPLNGQHVKRRRQAGRSLAYIEGWKVIAEANRIFGFDGWTRETVDLRCVSEKERKIGQDKRDGWGAVTASSPGKAWAPGTASTAILALLTRAPLRKPRPMP